MDYPYAKPISLTFEISKALRIEQLFGAGACEMICMARSVQAAVDRETYIATHNPLTGKPYV